MKNNYMLEIDMETETLYFEENNSKRDYQINLELNPSKIKNIPPEESKNFPNLLKDRPFYIRL